MECPNEVVEAAGEGVGVVAGEGPGEGPRRPTRTLQRKGKHRAESHEPPRRTRSGWNAKRPSERIWLLWLRNRRIIPWVLRSQRDQVLKTRCGDLYDKKASLVISGYSIRLCLPFNGLFERPFLRLSSRRSRPFFTIDSLAGPAAYLTSQNLFTTQLTSAQPTMYERPGTSG